MTGVVIRLLWAAPVDLFFAAVSAFGCMAACERERDDPEHVMSDRFRLAAVIAAIASVNLLMLVVVGVFYLLSARNRRRAALVVDRNRRFIDGFSDRLRALTGRVRRLGDARLIREGDDPAILAGHVREAGEQLSALAEEIQSYSEVLRDSLEAEAERKAQRQDDAARTPTRAARRGVIAALLAALVIVSFFCVRIAANWGDTRLNREADRYENRLNEWITEQTSILYMFTDTISAQPEIMDDYDTAVRWLNSIARKYPDISACYMANPYAEIPVIMNTGWIPGEDDRRGKGITILPKPMRNGREGIRHDAQ